MPKRVKHPKVSPAKARMILRDGEIRGKPLTGSQERLFGLIAGGGTPTRLKKRSKKRKKRA